MNSSLVTHVLPVAVSLAIVGLGILIFVAQGAVALEARKRRRAHVTHRTLRGDLTALAATTRQMWHRPDPLEQHLQRGVRRALAQVGGPR